VKSDGSRAGRSPEQGKHDLANDPTEIVSGSSRKRGNSFSEFSKTRRIKQPISSALFRGWCWSYVEGQHPDLPIIALTNH
jgi:hypothetical protein